MAAGTWVRRGVALAMTAGLVLIPAGQGSAAVRVPWCGNADLKASFTMAGAAAGTSYGRLRLRNVSDHACRTGGYGGLSYVGGGDGTQIGAAAVRDPGRVRVHLVEPGRRVVSRVRMVTAQNYPKKKCRPAHVDGFRVYVPDATLSQYVAFPTTGCKNHRVHVLGHKPYHRP